MKLIIFLGMAAKPNKVLQLFKEKKVVVIEPKEIIKMSAAKPGRVKIANRTDSRIAYYIRSSRPWSLLVKPRSTGHLLPGEKVTLSVEFTRGKHEKPLHKLDYIQVAFWDTNSELPVSLWLFFFGHFQEKRLFSHLLNMMEFELERRK